MSSGSKRLVLVREPDPAVELGVAGELPVEAGHADQDDAHVAAVEEVPELVPGHVVFSRSASSMISSSVWHRFGRVPVQLGVVVGLR